MGATELRKRRGLPRYTEAPVLITGGGGNEGTGQGHGGDPPGKQTGGPVVVVFCFAPVV